jgi:hypothetical protein
MISRAELETLMRHRAKPCVTLTQPTDPPGLTIRQDSVRLGNLIGQCEGKLATLGLDRTDIAPLLQPARAVIADDGFWATRRRGLALFLAPGFSRIIDLPRPVEELATVGERFRIAPLLPFVGERKTAFYLLAVTAARAALFRVDAEGMSLEDADLPQGVQSVANTTDYEQNVATPPDQNLGTTPVDLHKGQLLEYLNKLASAVKARIGHVQVPVLLAAQPEIAGNFRKQSELNNLWSQHLDVNPDALDGEQLRRRAWELLAEEVEDDAEESIDHFNSLFHGSSPRAKTRPDEVVRAARWGRLDTLILAEGQHVWGRFDEQADRVETHRELQAGDDDLLDRAALETLLNGGEVKVVDRDHVPGGGYVAAILRY